MQVEAPLAHGTILAGLWRAAREARLPHALSFEGPMGVGRFLAAKWLAMGLLCRSGPGEPCGACGPCKRVLSGGRRGNHPDLHVIDPLEDGLETIKIERIVPRTVGVESVVELVSLTAMEGGWRIVLIRESHRMNEAAQNALLKTLEEPTPGTLLVLETHRPGRLLATIRSRVVRVRFGRLTREEAASVLASRGMEAGEAAVLARWSCGSPGAALAWAQRGGAELRRILVDVLEGRRPPLAAARAAFELEGSFPGATPLARERARARTVLDLALALLADVLRWRGGLQPDELDHGDLLEDGGGPALGAAAARGRIAALLSIRRDVELNLAPPAAIERSLLVLCAGPLVPSPA